MWAAVASVRGRVRNALFCSGFNYSILLYNLYIDIKIPFVVGGVVRPLIRWLLGCFQRETITL